MSPPIRIDDPADPRVAPYLAIRERDLTGRGDRFIVEGRVTLDILLRRSAFPVESVFVAENRLARLGALLKQAPADTPIYTASQGLFDEIAGFAVHRGILACARKTPAKTLESLLGADLIVVGIGLSNHDNVGALFRNAAAFGAGGVVLDRESCDPLYRKAIRVSTGTTLWLPYCRGGTGDEILKALDSVGFESWALTPRADAETIWARPVPHRLAILVGAEGPGLPDHIIDAARPTRIAMAAGVDSVNVATAAAIALSHVFTRRG